MGFMDEDNSIAMSFTEKIKGIMIKPAETFKKVKGEDMRNVLRYWLVLALISSLLSAIVFPFYLSSKLSPIGGTEIANKLGKIPVIRDLFTGGVSAVKMLALFVLGFIFDFVALFIGGAWFHLWVRLFGGKKSYRETIKAVVYASTPSLLFGWIPRAGSIFSLWSIVLEVSGFKELQSMSRRGAIAAVIVSEIILVIVAIFIAFWIIFLLF